MIVSVAPALAQVAGAAGGVGVRPGPSQVLPQRSAGVPSGLEITVSVNNGKSVCF